MRWASRQEGRALALCSIGLRQDGVSNPSRSLCGGNRGGENGYIYTWIKGEEEKQFFEEGGESEKIVK